MPGTGLLRLGLPPNRDPARALPGRSALPPAHAHGDGAKPPETRQYLAVNPLSHLWQDRAAMNASEKQFSFTRAALSTGGRAESKFLSAKVKSGCSEGGSPSSLGRKAPEFRTKELDGKV